MDEEKTPTVEGHLFRALIESKLIIDPESAKFSRCGRTDKGVSGLGQVISLDVRSALTREELEDPVLEKAARSRELTYLDSLNRLLPLDIRVLAWSSVASDFNARFDCKSRTYKYFFSKGHMDLEAMKVAAGYLQGEHDFRNFCKLDPSKDLVTYRRTVISLDIQPVSTLSVQLLSPHLSLYEVVLKGSAFLWHQVRCMMSVLFLIGQGLETPEVIHQLMDIETCDAKPEYPMASDLPLVLYDSEYEGLEWIYATAGNFPTPMRLFGQLQEQWTVLMLRGLMCQTFMESVLQSTIPEEDALVTVEDRIRHRTPITDGVATVVLGGGQEMRMSKYCYLMGRKRADSDKVKKDKYRARKRARLEL
ncbi:pseudouridine synthase [Spinellus fusiger]|nr:pseudouridine synthase [Spinellus fusiger]